MDRSNIHRYIRRIKIAGAGSNKPENSRGTIRNISKRKWAAISVFLVALLAFSAFAATRSLHKQAASSSVALHSPAPSAEVANDAPAVLNANVGGAQAFGEQPPQSQRDASAPNTTAAQAKPWDRKIIRTATIQLTVKDVLTSVDKVQLLAAQHGGYVFQSDSHQDGEYTVSSITIQVPTQEFDRIMPELRKLDGQVKKITSENVSSNDVTEEYTDLNSQLRNLQATEARVLALQQKADKLEDILTLDQQLRQVQGDIERIQGRLNFLSNHSDLSSITVSISPDKLPAQPAESETAMGWDPGQVAAKAWNASIEMLSGVATVAITVVVFLWWAVPLLLVGLWLASRSRRRTAPAMPPAAMGGPSA